MSGHILKWGDFMTDNKKGHIKTIVITAAIIAVCIIFNYAVSGKFLTGNNIKTLISHAIIPCFMAWALCFVFACDFTDMSLGAVVILAANMSGFLGETKLGYFGIIIGAVGVSMALMVFNFFLFAKSKIPSWVASIGMVMVYEAIAIFYSNHQLTSGKTIAQLSEPMRGLAKAPAIYVVFGIGFALAYLIYNRTTIGLKVRALGSGQKIAEAMGIDTVKTIITVGIICGIFVGCSAFLNESYSARISVKTGLTSMTMIFQPIASVMLAQVLKAKINIIIGIPICALLVYGIFNMLTIAGVPSGTLQEAVLGLIVIVFGILAQRKQKKVVK